MELKDPKNVTIEVNSLSLESSAISRPHEVLVPQYVTAAMIENAKEAVSILQNEFPDNQIGVSLHAGEVIDLKKVEESGLPITSFDIPDVVTPWSTFQKFLRSPYLINRIAWALNSTVGINERSAYERHEYRMRLLEEMKLMQKPFVRLSVSDKESTLKTLSAIPKDWTVAVEFNPEHMSAGRYLEFLERLHYSNPNVGISIDLAHLAECYMINEGFSARKAKVFAIDFFYGVLNSDTVPVLSLDINNLAENGAVHYGQTHRGIFERGLLDLRRICNIYAGWNSSSVGKRVNIEFSPKDKIIFFDAGGRAWFLDQISPLNGH